MRLSLLGMPSLPRRFRPMFTSSSRPKSFRRRRSKLSVGPVLRRCRVSAHFGCSCFALTTRFPGMSSKCGSLKTIWQKMSTLLLVRCRCPGFALASVANLKPSHPFAPPSPPPQPPFLRLSHTISSPQSADQQANLRAASVLKQQEEAQAAAKSRLVAAITQAKVGKDVQLTEAPHL